MVGIIVGILVGERDGDDEGVLDGLNVVGIFDGILVGK